MATVSVVGPLPAGLRTSASDPLCERVNKVAWSSIWPFALAIGLGIGSLISWGWAFNPLITLPITVGLALFACAVCFLFQWPLPYEIDDEYQFLEDVVTQAPLCNPWIARPCGHTADAQSAYGFINKSSKCTNACTQELAKADFIPNRLIMGLLNALHAKEGEEAHAAFRAFVERHRDESMVLPDGRSCNLLGAVLLNRAQVFSGDWEAFCEANKADMFRGETNKVYRIGVDPKDLQAVLGQGGQINQQLEDLYKRSTYNRRWERAVDKYMEQRA